MPTPWARASTISLSSQPSSLLLDTARQVVETLEDTELEIAKIVSGDSGELKVGAQCVFCYKWLPNVMGIFQKKLPNIDFEIGNSNDPVKELASKQFDIVITSTAVEDDNITFLPLFEDQLVCIMHTEAPVCANPFIRLEDFGGLSLISPSEKRKNKFYQQALKPLGIEPKRYMAVGQSQAIIEMVAAGFGVSLFPRWAIRSLLETNTIAARPITKNGILLTWQAAFLKNNNLPVFQKEFINIVSKMNIPML